MTKYFNFNYISVYVAVVRIKKFMTVLQLNYCFDLFEDNGLCIDLDILIKFELQAVLFTKSAMGSALDNGPI